MNKNESVFPDWFVDECATAFLKAAWAQIVKDNPDIDFVEVLQAMAKQLGKYDWETLMHSLNAKGVDGSILGISWYSRFPGRTCKECGVTKDILHETTKMSYGPLTGILGSNLEIRVCSSCLTLLEEQKRQWYEKTRPPCYVCGERMASCTGRYNICRECRKQGWGREVTRVQQNNSRARQLNEPDTLSVEDWFKTLKDFDYCCAYCGEEYTILEHFIPLGYGGGTTAQNCVPSCQKCNSQKGHTHPSIERDNLPLNLKARCDEIAVYFTVE